MEELQYEDCSTNVRCQTCLNEYLCNYCSNPSVNCCPKYCLTCTGKNQCSKCQAGFTPKNTLYGILCQNIDSTVDIHRNPTFSTLCVKGYYLDTTLNFCERCRVPNCRTC